MQKSGSSRNKPAGPTKTSSHLISSVPRECHKPSSGSHDAVLALRTLDLPLCYHSRLRGLVMLRTCIYECDAYRMVVLETRHASTKPAAPRFGGRVR